MSYPIFEDDKEVVAELLRVYSNGGYSMGEGVASQVYRFIGDNYDSLDRIADYLESGKVKFDDPNSPYEPE
jgi:hypothetical protein